jgi:RNA polymerase sigma-70 factor (ECF subfamily)
MRERTGTQVEQSLRARVRSGDRAAFEQIFVEYAKVVYRYAVRLTGDWSEAEDVVSLTFLEAWRLRKKVHPDGESLQPWLLGIATNVLRNRRRSARRHQDALTRLPRTESVPDFADELLARMVDSERLSTTRAALLRLSPGEREVFVLYVWEGLSHAAVAEALGVRPGTVRARLSRGRSRLRKLTEDERQRESGSGQVLGNRRSADRSIQEKNR